MRSKSTMTSEKLRGGFYTPVPLARFLAEWATHNATTILEPSCGDGAFLTAISSIGRTDSELLAVEIDEDEAQKARDRHGNPKWNVLPHDYLTLNALREFDAVVGNPPFVRYQYMSNDTHENAARLYKSLGLSYTRHTNLWVPFLIKAISELRPGGRLGMVVPAELLNVLHAGAAREFLLKECSQVVVVDTSDLAFEGALQRTLLLAAVKRERGDSGTCLLGFTSVDSRQLSGSTMGQLIDECSFVDTPPSRDKWMRGLLTADEARAFDAVRRHKDVSLFSKLATVQVGMVTGANSFFMVNETTADAYDLWPYLRPMLGRSSQVAGLTYTPADQTNIQRAGKPCLFLDLTEVDWKDLPANVKRYIEHGEDLGLNLRYKTRIRKPWWRVPSVYATDLALMKRSHEAPRILLNTSGALTTDTAYRITTPEAPEQLVGRWVNSLTLLACELQGRTYGGGVLELVPSEIRSLPIPLVTLDQSVIAKLDTQLRSGASVRSLLPDQNTHVSKQLGIPLTELQILEAARERMFMRRSGGGTHDE